MAGVMNKVYIVLLFKSVLSFKLDRVRAVLVMIEVMKVMHKELC